MNLVWFLWSKNSVLDHGLEDDDSVVVYESRLVLLEQKFCFGSWVSSPPYFVLVRAALRSEVFFVVFGFLLPLGDFRPHLFFSEALRRRHSGLGPARSARFVFPRFDAPRSRPGAGNPKSDFGARFSLSIPFPASCSPSRARFLLAPVLCCAQCFLCRPKIILHHHLVRAGLCAS
jgi:hypothetical protein